MKSLLWVEFCRLNGHPKKSPTKAAVTNCPLRSDQNWQSLPRPKFLASFPQQNLF
jgi:hypothetical protein